MSQAIQKRKKKKHGLKVAMVGDPQIGKTSLMVKYVEGKFNEDYIQTLGKYLTLTTVGKACSLVVAQ
jgi:GTPase SAR1 family protein